MTEIVLMALALVVLKWIHISMDGIKWERRGMRLSRKDKKPLQTLSTIIYGDK